MSLDWGCHTAVSGRLRPGTQLSCIKTPLSWKVWGALPAYSH